jgi:hypothetical protein
LFLAEQGIRQFSADPGFIDFGVRSGTVNEGFFNAGTPLICLSNRQSDGTITNASTNTGQNRGGPVDIETAARDSRKGSRWADGRAAYTTFSAVLQPNSPTCSRAGVEPTRFSFLNTVGSYHLGGVNVVMGDRSVRFISETINNGQIQFRLGGDGAHADWEGTRTHSGPSTYGVWGALGSANGGDSASL